MASAHVAAWVGPTRQRPTSNAVQCRNMDDPSLLPATLSSAQVAHCHGKTDVSKDHNSYRPWPGGCQTGRAGNVRRDGKRASHSSQPSPVRYFDYYRQGEMGNAEGGMGKAEKVRKLCGGKESFGSSFPIPPSAFPIGSCVPVSKDRDDDTARAGARAGAGAASLAVVPVVSTLSYGGSGHRSGCAGT